MRAVQLLERVDVTLLGTAHDFVEGIPGCGEGLGGSTRPCVHAHWMIRVDRSAYTVLHDEENREPYSPPSVWNDKS
jgi:hypothetical protein